LHAVENYDFTGIPISHYPRLVRSLVYINKTAALTNLELGFLPAQLCQAIVQACDDILNGEFMGEFVVDVIQGGPGTSTNMNANKVIANRALGHLGFARGRYDVLHALNLVNLSQSTNDVYPTALRLTLRMKMDGLIAEMRACMTRCMLRESNFRM
jgi:aspartate ammonia-lyase